MAAAQRLEDGVTTEQIADDFEISEGCLRNWLRQAEIEVGHRPGTTVVESAESWDLRKRNRQMGQKNEVLRRAAADL